jgi:formylglycine-generating enzyme required for sulfatase activity
LQEACKLIQQLQGMVRKAGFAEAEGAVVQLRELTQSEPLRELWSQRVQETRGKHEAATERARAAQASGRFAEALELVKEALGVCPESAEANAVREKSKDGMEDDRLYAAAVHNSENKRQSKDFIAAREALESYRKERPRGRHVAEAKERIGPINRDAAAQKKRQLLKRLIAGGVVTALIVGIIIWMQVASQQREKERQAQAERNRIAQEQAERERVAREQVAREQVAREQAARWERMRGQTKTLDLGRGVKMQMVFIAPGEFLMGSDDFPSDEKPVHRVKITKGFWMGKCEVTQEQWEAVMGTNPSNFKGAQNPVELVSWIIATEFCRKTGTRLPTEAEWEYACRAGTTTKYNSGDSESDLARVSWYTSNSGSQTHPVGQKAANPWGLYDMHGNVREWCADWYGNYPSGEVANPTGAADGSARVLRGGSWISSPDRCRSADRNWGNPGDRINYFGFRVCLDFE